MEKREESKDISVVIAKKYLQLKNKQRENKIVFGMSIVDISKPTNS